MIKKLLFASLLFIGCLLTADAQIHPTYCMTYDDFIDNRWMPIDSLVEGRTKRICQLKFQDDQYRLRTGDKEADAVLKKAALVVEYGGHLYVNCRNLRHKDVPLDVNGYSQAYRFEDNKLLVVVHWVNGLAMFAGIAGDVATMVSPLPVALPTAVASTALWLNMDKLNSYRCYIIDSEANAKGKTAVTRITDEVMSELLADDPALLERYMAVGNNKSRQSASNILPFLMEKKLISDK